MSCIQSAYVIFHLKYGVKDMSQDSSLTQQNNTLFSQSYTESQKIYLHPDHRDKTCEHPLKKKKKKKPKFARSITILVF